MSAFQRISYSDRIEGGLLGLLVGDALGVPYEFHPPINLPRLSEIEMEPPAGFRRSHSSVPPGTWSDDGAQALVLAESLLRMGELDLPDFSRGLLRWQQEGCFAVDGRVFDIGCQTSQALAAIARGVPPESSGPGGETDNGNGSLMRVLPVLLWHRGPAWSLAAVAARQSLPTHGHPRAHVACAMYCLWGLQVYHRARAFDADVGQAWDAAAITLRGVADVIGFPEEEVERVLDPANASRARGSGYVLDTLWSARQCVEEGTDFESTVKAAVAMGHDTDTTTAVAGGIAGLLYGRSGIPDRWLSALRGQDLLEPILDGLKARVATQSRLTRRMPIRSDTHPLQVTWLKHGDGAIGVTECPGAQNLMVGDSDGTRRVERSLEEDIQQLASLGARVLVTCLPGDRTHDLGIENLPFVCEANGIEWLHLAVADGPVADDAFLRDLAVVSEVARQTLSAGERVVVHRDLWFEELAWVLEHLLLALDSNEDRGEIKEKAAKLVDDGIAVAEVNWCR